MTHPSVLFRFGGHSGHKIPARVIHSTYMECRIPSGGISWSTTTYRAVVYVAATLVNTDG